MQNLITILEETNRRITDELGRFTDERGKLRKDQLLVMKNNVEQSLDYFKNDYDFLIQNGIDTNADLILARDYELFSLAMAGAGKLVDINLTKIKDPLIQAVFARQEADGLKLSDRIWRITEESKLDINQKIQRGILFGESHVKIARDIKKYVIAGKLRFNSERLALTEMAKTYKLANEMALDFIRKQSTGLVWFEKWELSPSHPKPDVCDILASQNLIGEGPGVYKVAPRRHPGCLCLIYPVYRNKLRKDEFISMTDMKPETENLPPSQVKMAKELTK